MIRSTVIALASALLLGACGKTIDTTCSAFVPISYSASKDTPETVTQVRQHNAAWAALCQ